MNLFEALDDALPQSAITNLGNLSSEFDTTQSCAETGCGPGPA